MKLLELSPEDIPPIRIMFIISGLNRGGAEGLVVDLVNNLDRQYFKPILCVLHSGVLLSEVRSDVTVFSELIKWGGDIRVLPKLIRIIQNQSPSIIDVISRDDAALWGRIAAKLAGTAIILNSEHHGRFTFLQDPKRMFHHLLNRLPDFWTNAFVMVSQAQRDFFVKKGLPPDRISVIHNGIDIKRFSFSMADRIKVRKSLGLPDEAPVIGMVANFWPVKRHVVLLQAMVKVRETLPTVHCLLMGDGSLRVKMEEMAKQSGLSGAISFLGSRPDVPEILSALDVFVLTSDSESFSNVIVEAMAAGKPVVTTDCGGPQEIVEDGVTGYLVPVGHALELSKKISILLKNPELAGKMGEAGRLHAERNFGLDKMVMSRESLFLQLFRQQGFCKP